MRVGLVGTGRWAQVLFANFPKSFQLRAVLTRSNNRLSSFPSGVHWVNTIDDLMSFDLDGVIVANASSLHLDTVIEIRRRAADMPILVEKPFSMDFGSLSSFCEACSGNEPILVNHALLFDQRVESVRRQSPHISAGKMFLIDGNLGPFRSDCDPLWDYGPHPISTAIYLATKDSNEEVEFTVDEASWRRLRDGDVISVSLTINRTVKVYSMFGNGFPFKIRTYVFDSREFSRTINLVTPTADPPLSNVMNCFQKLILSGDATKDSRLGVWMPLNVAKILEEIGFRLTNTNSARLDESTVFREANP